MSLFKINTYRDNNSLVIETELKSNIAKILTKNLDFIESCNNIFQNDYIISLIDDYRFTIITPLKYINDALMSIHKYSDILKFYVFTDEKITNDIQLYKYIILLRSKYNINEEMLEKLLNNIKKSYYILSTPRYNETTDGIYSIIQCDKFRVASVNFDMYNNQCTVTLDCIQNYERFNIKQIFIG